MTAMLTLEQLLKQLRLPHMAGAWQCQEKQALSEGWSPSRYLLSLCSEEAAYRESERLRRYRREARLPAGKALSEFVLIMRGAV